MTTQLTLLPTSPWKLDEETKRIGRHGLDQARAILASRRSTDTAADTATDTATADHHHALAA